MTFRTHNIDQMKTMHHLRSSKGRFYAGAGLALVVAATYALSSALLTGADPKAAAKPEKKKPLSGSELYAVHCNRCHAERYPTEFTAAQWKTIMLQMRVRANLPAAQAKAILQYLQEDAGN